MLGEREPDLIHLLDALVRRDLGPSGLEGEVCIAVRNSDGYRFWHAVLGARPRAELVSALPKSANVTLFLTDVEAKAILETGKPLPTPELMMATGDRQLLKRFVRRYTSRTDWLGIRVGARW